MKIIRIFFALMFSMFIGDLVAYSINLPDAAFLITPAIFAASFLQFTPVGALIMAYGIGRAHV